MLALQKSTSFQSVDVFKLQDASGSKAGTLPEDGTVHELASNVRGFRNVFDGLPKYLCRHSVCLSGFIILTR